MSKSIRPMMNGASDRLRYMREELENIEADLGLAVLDLATTRRAIERIHVIRNGIDEMIMTLRNAETLAYPKNWRLLASYDLSFAIEFLDKVDRNILRMALTRCQSETLDCLRTFLEVSDGQP